MRKYLITIAFAFLPLLAQAQAYGPPFNPAKVPITGGTINGTSIGATTPASGKFTTLDATGLQTQAVTNSTATSIFSMANIMSIRQAHRPRFMWAYSLTAILTRPAR